MPNCNVCDKPEQEHRGNLFCCWRCGAAVEFHTYTRFDSPSKYTLTCPTPRCLVLEFDSAGDMYEYWNTRYQKPEEKDDDSGNTEETTDR